MVSFLIQERTAAFCLVGYPKRGKGFFCGKLLFGGVNFFLKQLPFVKIGVFAAEGEKLVVGAAFDYAAVIEDAN